MYIRRTSHGRQIAIAVAATFDPNSRALLLSREPDERGDWTTVALVFCSLLLFAVLGS